MDNIRYIKTQEECNQYMEEVRLRGKNFEPNSTNIDWNEVYYIPLQEVKELIGEVDVEKKAENKYPYEVGYSVQDENYRIGELQDAFKAGYNQALEDNKEKKYTEDDMRMAYFEGKSYVTDTPPYFDNFEQFIQSLQPKTEWKVEIVDGKLKLK